MIEELKERLDQLPRSTIFLASALVVLFGYLLLINALTDSLIYIFVAVTIGVILLGTDSTKNVISIEKAYEIAYRFAKMKQNRGDFPQGNLEILMDGSLRKDLDGKPFSFDVCVKVHNLEDKRPYKVFSLNPFTGAIEQIVSKPHWSAEESPNVKIIRPPDILTYLELKRNIEEKYGTL